VDANGMDDGEYHAWLYLEDNFNGAFVIPVNMTIDTHMGELETGGKRQEGIFNAYPNPFIAQTVLSILLPETTKTRIEISTLQGQIMKVIDQEVKGGIRHLIEWDGNNEEGKPVGAGIYSGRLITGNKSYFVKIIKIR